MLYPKAPAILLTIFLGIALIAPSTQAESTQKPTAEQKQLLAVTDDAKEFARLDESFPLVVNYFTKQNVESLRSFYQEHYGQVLSEETKRGRLQLNYQAEGNAIRVIISEQNNARQVDLIIE